MSLNYRWYDYNEETKFENPVALATDSVIKEESMFGSDFQENIPPAVKSKKTKKLVELPHQKPRKEKINSTSAHQEFIPVASEHPRTKEIILSKQCKHCDQVMMGSNPTNLKLHLKRKHREIYKKVKNQDDAFKSQLRSVTHTNPEDSDVILERDDNSGSVEAAEEELNVIMDQEILEENTKLEPGNQECVQEKVIENQRQLDSLSKYTDIIVRKPASVHLEFRPVEMHHPYTNEKIEGRECKHCQTVISGKNSTNLNTHLISFHPAIFKKTKGKFFVSKQTSLHILFFSALDLEANVYQC